MVTRHSSKPQIIPHPPPLSAAQPARPQKMEAKLQEASDNHAISGPLQRTKTALRQLKADIKAMDVLIGAKSATLLANQFATQRAGERWRSIGRGGAG